MDSSSVGYLVESLLELFVNICQAYYGHKIGPFSHNCREQSFGVESVEDVSRVKFFLIDILKAAHENFLKLEEIRV